MGMFDRIYDDRGREWQTKALGRALRSWRVGDTMPLPFNGQVEVVGGAGAEDRWGLATIRAGVLVEVPARRDPGLPVTAYGGLWCARSVEDGEEWVD